LEPRITRISSPVRINLRLLIDVVEKRKRGRAKRAVPPDDQQSNDQPAPAHQCFFLNSLARRRDRLVRPTIDVIFMMRDRAAALEHRI